MTEHTMPKALSRDLAIKVCGFSNKQMRTYHLGIKDKEDHQFDIDYHFSHPSKDATNLYDDFYKAYDKVSESENDWGIVDILNELEKMGWTKADILTVDVYY
jgi:hypothetical protein